MRVLVTGSSGYLGTHVIPALLADPRVSAVRGTDVVSPGPRMPGDSRYAHVELDLVRAEDAQLDALLDGIDVVLHLAFRMAPRPGENLHGINVTAQERFLRRAVLDDRRVIVASAAAAYGFDSTRDPLTSRVTEDAPLSAAGVEYADHKQHLEHLLDRLASHGALIIRARPSNVAGPELDPRRAPQLTGAVMLAPQTRHPIRQQLLHEQDMAAAFLTLLDAPPGAYNVAPDDWLTLEEAASLLGQRYMTLPGWVLRPLVDLAWRGGRSLFDGSWLTFLENPPIILSNDKLKSLGWAPRYTTKDTLLAVVTRYRERCGV